MNEEYKEWLNGLTVGDRVVVRVEDIMTTWYVSSVVKITPTQKIRVGGFESLLFKDGDAHATNMMVWYSLEEPTPENIDKYNLATMRKYLANINWNTIDDVLVKEVRELLR